MKAGLLLVVAVTLSVAPPPSFADDHPAPTELDAFDGVEGLRFASSPAKGQPALLALSAGRRVKVFKGLGRGPWLEKEFETGVKWVWPAADGSRSFVETPRIERGALAFVDDETSVVLTPVGEFRPQPDGLHWDGVRIPVPLRRRVSAPGSFLEDSLVSTIQWPFPTKVDAWSAAGGKPAAFFLDDDALRAFARTPEKGLVAVTWPTGFLPSVRDGRALLVDLDGDGAPDLAHEAATNDSGTYTFFKVAPPPGLADAKAGGPPIAGPDLRPARGQIRLTGFQLWPDHVDLDGDGRLDFVVTTIEIDGKNVIAAVMKGRVTARTRAFLNRSAKGDVFFAGTPDAEVESSIAVKIQFTFSGSIDVKRSYTILATADLDGDGRKDLVIRTGPDVLSVRRGVEKGVWASEPYEIPIPPIGDSPDIEGYAGDMNGDGKDDLVLLYRAPPGGKDRTYLLVSP